VADISLASRAHSFRPRLAVITPGCGRNGSAAGPSEPPARYLKRPRLSLTSPTKLVSQR
jgi:hypothetical protein